MKRKKITKIMMILFLVTVFVVALNFQLVSGHEGDVLTALASTPPTIDGMISPADEWDEAAQVSVFAGGYEGSVFYIMNDANNLYLALRVIDSTFTTGDAMDVRFDNEHDGLLSDKDDEIKATIYDFRDMHYVLSIPSWGIPDSQIDGSGGAGTLDGSNFFEMSHPLNSYDTNDFSLSAGDIVGFCLSYYDDHLAYWSTYYPLGSGNIGKEQSLYGDIMIASPVAATIDVNPDLLVLLGRSSWINAYIELPSDYEVVDIDVASIEFSCDVTDGVDPYTSEIVPSAPITVGDRDGDGISDLMVMFDRFMLVDYLQTYLVGNGMFYDLSITITGTVSGTPFEGTDTIRVMK